MVPKIALCCNLIVVSGGVLRYHKNKMIPWNLTLPLVAVSVPFAWLGGYTSISQFWFSIALGSSLFLAGFTMLLRPSEVLKTAEWTTTKSGYFCLSIVSGGLGFLAGLVGIGGGIFFSPLLHLLKTIPSKNIAAFLVNEHPQTAAIVLAHLDEGIVGSVIEELPEEKRTEIMLRLATLERVSPNVIRELDVALQGELRQQGAASGNRLGGVALTAQIIGTMDKDIEAGIMAELEESNPELAQQINDLRFVFEDINKIDDPGIQLILKEIDQAGLPLALKTASDELKEKLFFNMSERASDMLKDDLENLPPTKLADVEKEQKKIIEVCKKLEGEGKIQVGGAGEELV